MHENSRLIKGRPLLNTKRKTLTPRHRECPKRGEKKKNHQYTLGKRMVNVEHAKNRGEE